MSEAKPLTVQQTAERLGVTLKYVRDLLYESKLPGAKKGRQEMVYPRQDHRSPSKSSRAVSMPAQPLAYTDAEVSSLLRVSKRTVYRLRKSGVLQTLRIGRAVRIPAEAVTRFIESNTIPAEEERQ